MTKSVFSKTLAAAVAIALIAGSTVSSAEAKDGRRAAALVGALVGIAGALVDATAGQSDQGYRPARHQRRDGFQGHGFREQRFEARERRFDGHRFGRDERRDHGFKKDRGPRTRIGEAWCSNPGDC